MSPFSFFSLFIVTTFKGLGGGEEEKRGEMIKNKDGTLKRSKSFFMMMLGFFLKLLKKNPKQVKNHTPPG